MQNINYYYNFEPMAFNSGYKELSFNDTMPFGKYKDLTIAEIVRVNQGYLKWLTENTKTKIDSKCLSVDPSTALRFITIPDSTPSLPPLSERQYIDLTKWNRISIIGDPKPEEF